MRNPLSHDRRCEERDRDRPARRRGRRLCGRSHQRPEWYDNIDSVTWLTDPPVQQGSKLAFVAQFLGRKLEYTYVLTDFVPGERIVMRTEEGPFPMETTTRGLPTATAPPG